MYDMIVIGGGPAGVTAALRARELGATVALIERARLGGTCTNDGCAPTRVLARTARLMRDARQFEEYGLIAEPPTVDFARVMARTQQVVYQLQEKKQLLAHLQDVGVTVFQDAGNASFVDAHSVRIADTGDVLQGNHFILCVGGRPRRLDFPGSELALTHSDIWSLRKRPDSVMIVGGGATGVQLASIFEDFGSEVAVMDVAPRLLPGEDPQVSEAFAAVFKARGIEVIPEIEGLTEIERRGTMLRLTYRRRGQFLTRPIDAVILAVGWPGNVDTLNLAAAGVETERSYIKVNEYLQTTAPHIYAAGDITGRMMLVQSASYQATYAVENALLNAERNVEHRLVPHGGFTDPEYGSVGMTEPQARAQMAVEVTSVPYADMDRAVIDDRLTGFCKLIVNRENLKIVGAHLVGEQAVEIVQLIAAGMASGLSVEQLANLELAYPTYAAIVGLAARQIVRSMNLVHISQEWRTLKKLRPGEWERADPT